MDRTAVVFSPVYYRHDPGRERPESARRLGVIVNELRRGGLSKSRNWRFVEPSRARTRDVQLVHDREYVRFVEAVCKSGGGILDSGDTVVSPESYEVALYAVGGALKAVNLVMERRFQNAFALVRPPGHHASKFEACGFCIFNNIAIAAKHLLERRKLERILIVDVDAHHGNGTQEIFYETDKVLYVSLHEDPRSFPGTGFVDEIGEGKGLGYTVNIPLPFGTGDHTYLKAVREIVVPIARQYKPQFVLVSAGFDGHFTDPVAELSLSTACYEEVYATITDLASETCDGRLAAFLEGGYSLKVVGKMTATAIAKMSQSRYVSVDEQPPSGSRSRRQGEEILREVRRVQGAFWEL